MPSTDLPVRPVRTRSTPRSVVEANRRRRGAEALLGALLLLLPVASGHAAPLGGDAPPAVPAAKAESIGEWSDRIWNAARDGDRATVESELRRIPDGIADGDVRRLREAVEQLERTRLERRDATAADLAKALEEMRTELAADRLPEALAAASNAKLLSDAWPATLASDDVVDLLRRSEALAASAEEQGDWLLAQEVLFRLRVLVDQAERVEDEKRYTDALERVNRRIGLLAQYAPHRLHDLRRLQSQRMRPEAEFPAFNELGADDWKDQLKGITQRMLRAALRYVAGEHIDDKGWAPLLDGGLEALRILATTDGLEENFPGLREPEKVARWVETIDRLRAGLAEKRPRAITLEDYQEIMGRLELTNRDTIQIPSEVLYREFGDGAAYALARDLEDAYTEIIWPERLRRFQQQTEGNFVGVGILIRHNERREILVVNPLEGSPAFRAGIRSEDRIATVDGQSTLGWSLNRAVDLITGPRGKQVVLGIQRGEGEEVETVEYPIVRDTIKIRSVNGWWKRGLDASGVPEWDWMIDPHSGIGYVRLTGFNEESYDDFLGAIDQMRARGPLNGLILDLRGNPGGLLKSAVQFSNLFLQRGEIVLGEDRLGAIRFRYEAQPGRADVRLVGLPLVVLVNEASASASEIVAGALQAHGAAVIVGERTFGKGSVQEVRDVSDREAAAVKLTTQFYLLPARPGEAKGRLVHRRPQAVDWGVNPDIQVAMSAPQVDRMLRLRAEADLIPGAEAGEEPEFVVEDEDAVVPPPAGGAPAAVTEESLKPRVRPDPSELLTKGIDPQLQTALLLLQARALKVLEAHALGRS